LDSFKALSSLKTHTTLATKISDLAFKSS